MNDGTLVKQIDTAREFLPEKPPREEADTTAMTDMGLEMARRASKPAERPPEAAPAQTTEPKPVPMVFNFR